MLGDAPAYGKGGAVIHWLAAYAGSFTAGFGGIIQSYTQGFADWLRLENLGNPADTHAQDFCALPHPARQLHLTFDQPAKG
jgi:hypothetical protein